MRHARWPAALTLSFFFTSAIALAQSPRTLSDLPPEAQAAVRVALPTGFGIGSSAPGSADGVMQGSWPQAAKLTPASGAIDLATSVAMDGDTIVVGAPAYFSNNGGGAALVFVKPKTGWRNMTQVATLTASDGQTAKGLVGCSVAISGDVIVAGAPGSIDSTNCDFYSPGAVYVFVKPANGWKDMAETAKLTVPNPWSNDNFGIGLGASVSIDGDVIVAGAPYSVNSIPGDAYVFVKPEAGWASSSEPTAKLTPSDPAQGGDRFGISVAVHNSTVVVGAPVLGLAYVFVEPPGGWKSMTQTARLRAATGEHVGDSVAVDANVVVVGSTFANGGLGAIFVFLKPQGGWRDKASDAELTAVGSGSLGASVALGADFVVAGAPYSSQGRNDREGAVYIFVKPSAGWRTTTNFQARLTGSDARIVTFFGTSVAASGGVIVGGAPWAVLGQGREGAAYVYEYVP